MFQKTACFRMLSLIFRVQMNGEASERLRHYFDVFIRLHYHKGNNNGDNWNRLNQRNPDKHCCL